MDNVFPALEGTLETMNRAQAVFGFELTDISLPLDVWDLEQDQDTPYLWAERLADRLRGRPVELGVELLACVTRDWMRNDQWVNLYGWWPDDKTPPIIIFSVAGFDELAPEGHETDRAIANALVAALAGFYGDMDSHSRPPADCPMAFNESRDFAHLVGPQRFDARCRARLRPKLGRKLEALDALLQAFA
jgi:hypothetical protein